jgi:hypothetical protein
MFEEERAKREAEAKESDPWQEDGQGGNGKSPRSKESMSNEINWDKE